MRFLVRWDPDAFHRLLQDFNAANKPVSGIRAFNDIELLLGADADVQGESREGNRRILIVPPLGVIFEARPDIAEVLILDAWVIADRSGRN
mgnify:CR=1 FL=1